MPAFYITFVDDGGVTTAEERLEAADIESARRLGMRAAGLIITEALAAGETTVDFSFCLADQAKNLLASIPIRTTAAPVPEHRVQLIFRDM
jgi:hypothetical protein